MNFPGVALAYHGCEAALAEAVVLGKQALRPSKNPYDWLGSGIYFWENSPRRALRWAEGLAKAKKIETPGVLGAVVHLGKCLDLLDAASLELVSKIFPVYCKAMQAQGLEVPKNEPRSAEDDDLVKRYLDCAVINFLHEVLKSELHHAGYDTVRGAFQEGTPVFQGSRIPVRTHIQLVVRNPERFQGFFLPRPMQGTG